MSDSPENGGSSGTNEKRKSWAGKVGSFITRRLSLGKKGSPAPSGPEDDQNGAEEPVVGKPLNSEGRD
jgi:hypothetical protein